MALIKYKLGSLLELSENKNDNLEYRMNIKEDKDEGGYVVSFPELPGCITCGETIESAVKNAEDAKKEWLMAALEEGIKI